MEEGCSLELEPGASFRDPSRRRIHLVQTSTLYLIGMYLAVNDWQQYEFEITVMQK